MAVAAPVLSVQNNRLVWSKVGSYTRYVLVEKISGKADRYWTAVGTSYTPTAVPGKTVRYGIRVDTRGSLWAKEVSISWPTTPAPTPSPEPVPTPAPTGPFKLGVVLPSNWPGVPAKAKAVFAPTLGRISDEASDSAVQQMVREAKSAGIEPHICYTGWRNSAATFVSFVQRYKALGVNRFEIGNETSYVGARDVPATADAYARQVKAYGDALRAAGVSVELLVQADDALRNAGWVANMYKAVPNLHDYAAGWVVHPYTAGREVERLNKAVSDTVAQGSPVDKPIYATEYGIASTVDGVTLIPDNYGHPTNLRWAEAGPLLARKINEMREGCRQLRAVWVYHIVDGRGAHNERESNFGVTTWPSLQTKREYADALLGLRLS